MLNLYQVKTMDEGTENSNETASADECQSNPEQPVEEDELSGSNDEYIGVDEQETRDDYKHLANFLSTEIEIKEEEVEIKEEEIEVDPELVLPDGDDPFGGAEAAASESSTDTAEEAEVVVRKKRKVPMKKKVKNVVKMKPDLSMPLVASRFVPGLMTRRHKKLVCLDCGQNFDSTVMFATHRKADHVQLPTFQHACSYCPRRFRTREDMNRHVLHHTRMEALHCPVCHAAFHSAKTLADHVMQHRGLRSVHLCVLCKINFPSVDKLEQHNLDVHSKPSVVTKTVSSTDLVCFACGTMEHSDLYLRQHIFQHKGPVSCKICGSSEPNMDKLTTHVTTVHQNQGTLTFHCCPNCNKTFASSQQLAKHQTNCSLPSSLQARHRLECDICHLSYFDAEHYETHMRLHAALGRESGTKPCQMCSFFAKTTSEYAFHMYKVHGVRDTIESLETVYERLNVIPPAPKASGSAAADTPHQNLKCVVPKCKEAARAGVLFHEFPSYETHPERWRRFVAMLRLPLGVPPMGEPARICSVHFSLVGFGLAELAAAM